MASQSINQVTETPEFLTGGCDLEKQATTIILHSNGGLRGAPGAEQRSMNRLAGILLAVQEFLGDQWRPTAIGVDHDATALPAEAAMFDGLPIMTHTPVGWVRFPREQLTATCINPLISEDVSPANAPGRNVVEVITQLLAAFDNCASEHRYHDGKSGNQPPLSAAVAQRGAHILFKRHFR